MRADAKRILIVSPGSLTEQWQDELEEKFGVAFELFSREKQEQCVTGNYFDEQNQLNLENFLGSLTRHFLLMTATPHNGKEEDFQLFLSLLDSDRFYGKFRDGAQKVDVSDIMRRMVKEDLLKFDGTRLFPERKAYTANYDLSDAETALYEDVTGYVRTEMNRADRLLDIKRRGTVGFALTLLQRRLASSPEAIHQSLNRRQKKLERRLEEMKQLSRGNHVAETMVEYVVKKRIDVPDDIDEAEEELTGEEYETWVEQVVDQATAAESVPELEAEIEILKDLKQKAHALVQSKSDRKWDELRSIMMDCPEMKTVSGSQRKLIIFTEHRDTLNYLQERISDVLGTSDAVVVIHGGVHRDERRKVQEEFRNNPDVLVLVATDAAGEGVNLQNANLMVNYDLPWNPNRMEQRFGRIHRIGQREVCHLWNLVANGTREGAVFQKLFEKLEVERAALGGRVFDILGEAFENQPLKNLLIDAIRKGELPEARARMEEIIEGALDTEHLKEILKRNALVEQRLAGKGGDPVIQLQTAFGGGKTHTMLAVYHLTSRKVGTDKLDGIPPVLDEAGIHELPKARVAVIDGIKLSPSQPRKYGKTTVNTLWGELAWQLLGQEGYDMVAASDRDGTSPGKGVLIDLLKKAAPCVILIDEMVAFIRQLEAGKYVAGSFDSNLSFIQALTEALKAVPNAMLLASLPESEAEVGGANGAKTLTALEKYFGRVESVWKPVTAEEAFEIVRRRLFDSIGDTSEMDAVCKAFAELYRTNADKFPAETLEGTYYDRLRQSYPIHPEIFDRLYEDWSTLDKFQRTRGVLQYMAIVIHRLWNDNNRDALIMPGSIPLEDSTVRNKSIHYLPQGWEPVLEREVDGPRSVTVDLDGHNTLFGSVQAARRSARTIFMGSAPASSAQKIRGLKVDRILLGSVARPEYRRV